MRAHACFMLLACILSATAVLAGTDRAPLSAASASPNDETTLGEIRARARARGTLPADIDRRPGFSPIRWADAAPAAEPAPDGR